MSDELVRYRLMTYNIGGGRKNFGSELESICQVIREHAPDILALQEVSAWTDAEENEHNTIENIFASGNLFQAHYFGPSLSMRTHFHPGKKIFIKSLFTDCLDWKQGNGLLSRWPFVRLSDREQRGRPQNLPIHRPAVYHGDRDTEPRHMVLARVHQGEQAPFIINTHLSTLVRERGGAEEAEPAITEKAVTLRVTQIDVLLQTIETYLLEQRETIFLMGDFNAVAEEASLQKLLAAGFVHLTPRDPIATHPKVPQPIDHIFVFPPERIAKNECRVIATPITQEASDHLPVVADVWLDRQPFSR
ncbi:MAG: endonuclease/exonuclease/phosphatase family protein [Chloroflexota bacterium]